MPRFCSQEDVRSLARKINVIQFGATVIKAGNSMLYLIYTLQSSLGRLFIKKKEKLREHRKFNFKRRKKVNLRNSNKSGAKKKISGTE